MLYPLSSPELTDAHRRELLSNAARRRLVNAAKCGAGRERTTGLTTLRRIRPALLGTARWRPSPCRSGEPSIDAALVFDRNGCPVAIGQL